MLHAMAYLRDDKARLHEFLPELAEALGGRSKMSVALDSYTVSATPYEVLRTCSRTATNNTTICLPL